MKKYFIWLLVLMSGSFVGFSFNSNGGFSNSISIEQKQDTIPFPTDSNYYQRLVEYISKELNLRKFSFDTDSLQLRLWLFPSFYPPSTIDINLSIEPPVAIWYSLIGTDNSTIVRVNPKSGWTIFSDSIRNLKILEDVSSDIDFLGNDGETIVVELVKDRKYYFISTNSEIFEHEDLWESKLVQILISEFDMIRED
ncbi:MAG: hypothetical protein SFU20_09485 [Chitinophagaceae bacterium]|nr:hypothetical protein [Chitinophagaceae bacterium]